jgi:DNA-binding MltR family transcriptional regulator
MPWAIFEDTPDKAAIIELVSSKSERVLAVVGGALLDEHVRRTLSERFRKSGVADGLLKTDAPLGNLGPKIDLLYLLHAIEKPTRAALNGLAEVRNFFAHNLDASFRSSDKKFLDAIGRLTLHENKSHYPHHLFDRDTRHEIEPVGDDNVTKFIINLQLALIALMRDRVSHVTHTNQPLTDDEILARFKRKPSE